MKRKLLSATFKMGHGSEQHNHDVLYREKEGVSARKDGEVIEILPYVPYDITLNKFMRPYIDEKNERAERLYQEHLADFKAKKRKSRPHKPVREDYDFYYRHKRVKAYVPEWNKTGETPFYRSLILMFGNQSKRDEKIIEEQSAMAIAIKMTKRLKEEFPNIIFLGSSMHCDEAGTYHLQIDYVIYYVKKVWKQGYRIGFGFERALEEMGYEPEQSFDNVREKAPLLINAFRNKCYAILERIYKEEGFLLEYGAAQKNNPDLEVGEKRILSAWQAHRDFIFSLQRAANEAELVFAEDIVDERDQEVLEGLLQGIRTPLRCLKREDNFFGKTTFRCDEDVYGQLADAMQRLSEGSAWMLEKMQRLYAHIETLQYDLKDRERDCAMLEAQLRQRGRDVQLPDLYRAER